MKDLFNLKGRLRFIVETSYDILVHQIVAGKFKVYNEASMQLQFSVILNDVGRMCVFDRNEYFDIELEENQRLTSGSSKSQKGKARCDVWMKLIHYGLPDSEGNAVIDDSAECAIELKYFRKFKGETTTDNRFKVLQDIENLEAYQSTNGNLIGYEIVYTDNETYTNEYTDSYLNIGNGQQCSGVIESNKRFVNLHKVYSFNWDKLRRGDVCHCFVKVPV